MSEKLGDVGKNVQTTDLTPVAPVAPYEDQFGYSVAVANNLVVIGAPYDDETGIENAGSVYVYDAITGSLLHTIRNPDPDVDDYFGLSVAISGDTVVVGAVYDDTGAENAGSAYIFDANSGQLIETLHNPYPAVDDRFGGRVAIWGRTVVATAYNDDAGATNSGSAYIFEIDSDSPTVSSIGINSNMDDPPSLPGTDQPSSWQSQRSSIRSLSLEFSQEMILSSGDLVLTNLGVNAPIDPDTEIPFTHDQISVSGHTMTIDFGSHPLPDGVYQLEVLPSATALDGTPLDGDGDGTPGGTFRYTGDAANRFFQLTGDFNGDGGVSIFDFTTFAYWFGRMVPEAPEYVDLNGDGGVTNFDFNRFAQSFGVELTYPTPLVGASFFAATRNTAGDHRSNEPDEPFRQLEHRLDRRSAPAALPPRAIRVQSGEVRLLESDTKLPDLDEVLQEISGDLLAAWNRAL